MNQENHQNLKTPAKKFKNLENPNFPHENHESHENPKVLLENHGTLGNHIIP